jgi:uncharacterized protein
VNTNPEPTREALPAGPLSVWVDEMQRALRGEKSSNVPCNGCTACCRSSQFVTIGPDESDTLAAIPPDLLFPAPGLPRHVLLGYDERGHCPMLTDDGCSVYEHRPRACRTYDCRIFAATGVQPDQPAVADQARRWVFDDDDPALHAALEAASARAREQPQTRSATEIAVRAIEDV